MKNKTFRFLLVIHFALCLCLFLGCRPDDFGGIKTKETGKVYFPDDDGIVAALSNYSLPWWLFGLCSFRSECGSGYQQHPGLYTIG